MNRLWLYSYPDGVPAKVDARFYASLNDLLGNHCAANCCLKLAWHMADYPARAHGLGFEVRHVPHYRSVVQIVKRLQEPHADARVLRPLQEARS